MPKSDYVCIGLDEIAVGTCRDGAGMTATLTTISNITPDSVVLAIEAPGKNSIDVEDSDYPLAVINTPGEKVVEWATKDMHPNHFLLAMGGTTTATGWKSSDAAVVTLEKSIRLKSKTVNGSYLQVDIVHANVRGGAQLKFAKSDAGDITFVADVLRPIAANTDRAIHAAIH